MSHFGYSSAVSVLRVLLRTSVCNSCSDRGSREGCSFMFAGLAVAVITTSISQKF